MNQLTSPYASWTLAYWQVTAFCANQGERSGVAILFSSLCPHGDRLGSSMWHWI
jgi:hypothetical protein